MICGFIRDTIFLSGCWTTTKEPLFFLNGIHPVWMLCLPTHWSLCSVTEAAENCRNGRACSDIGSPASHQFHSSVCAASCKFEMSASELMHLCAVVLGCSVLVMAASYPEAGGEPCQPDKLTVYKVVLQTFWTRDQFPKHYPDWRPSAQWSKLVGEYCSFPDMVVCLVTKSVIHVIRALICC